MYFPKRELTQLEKNDLAFNKEYADNLRHMTTYKPPFTIRRAKVNYVPEYVWKIFFEYMEIENKLDLPFVHNLRRT
jgi:hypothetical protein